MLLEAGGGTHFGGQPLVIRLLAFDDQKTSRHAGVTVATKLGTVDLVTALDRWLEPEGDAHTGDGILSYAQRDDFE